MCDEEPDPGDLIEILRGLFQHWAVYFGHGYIVHLVPNEDSSNNNVVGMFMTEKAMVKKEKLRQVAGSDKWKINNSLDKKYKPRPVDVIIKEAGELVGKELIYSVSLKNCEHFATELRYGKAESRQVQMVAQMAVMAGPVGMLGLGIAALTGAGSTSSRSSKKKKK